MKNIKYFVFVFFLPIIFFSCSDIEFGDKFLGEAPESSGATLDTMFNSKVNADKVLTKAYTYVPYGLSGGGDNKLGGNILEALTDLYNSLRDNIGDGPTTLYYSGNLSANMGSANIGNEAYRFASEFSYHAIRYAWIFIENVDRVPDMTSSEKAQRIAEAKMLIALSYAEMLRYVGGVPLITQSVDPNGEMNFPRATFEQTVNYIVGLIDECKNSLPWKQDNLNDGRMTKAGALGLKLRVLLFAASPMFNSSSPWHPEADEYTRYSSESKERWKAAKEAGDEFMKELEINRQYDLIQPEEATHEAYRKAFQTAYYDRGGNEILISTRRGYDSGTHQSFYDERTYSGVTLNYVNMFPWKDGSDFPADFDWKHPSQQPFYTKDGEPTRDPRLYETVAVPGDLYWNGTPAPVYINHTGFRPGGMGFLCKKFIMEKAADRVGRPIQWPYLRFAEVLLSYAEALNEFNGGPDALAYDCVNRVRNRVGLGNLPTGLSQVNFRKAILKERALEFGFEEVRWFDLIRWKMESEFQKTLYGLTSKALDDQNDPHEFSFTPFAIKDRFWKTSWNTKWFLAPIPQTEINKEYGMTQNPGW